MENPELKRESGVLEVKGGTEAEKAQALGQFESKFNQQEVKKFEREKTPEELKFIKDVNEKMKEFVEQYGGTFLEIKPENIHIIDFTKSKQLTYYGIFRPSAQEIVLTLTPDIPKLMVANLLVHEMIHFNSFQSVIFEKSDDEQRIKNRRVGVDVSMYKDGEIVDSMFRDLNEAVTEELAKRFDWSFFESIQYTETDTQKRNSIIEDIKSKSGDPEDAEEIAYYTSFQTNEGKWQTNLNRRTYLMERLYLKELVSGIFDKNPGKFKNKEEVFGLFARAALSGDLKELTDIIEATFGQGAFKRIGQKTRYDKSKNKSWDDII